MIFSPSQTTTYLECPMKWWLSRQVGWRPRVLQKRDAAAIIGSAFACGVAVWNRARQIATSPKEWVEVDDLDMAAACYAAEVEARNRITELLDMGCTVPTVLRGEFDYAPTIARRITERVCANDPIPQDWTIVDVEREFPDHGNARPDLVCREPDGKLTIVDYKVAMSLKDAWLPERLAGYKRSWQMHHYVRFGRIVYGEPITRYAIALVRVEPELIRLTPYAVDEGRLEAFAGSAEETWDAMERVAGEEGWPVTENWTACDVKFGPCEFQRACWDHGRDEALMSIDYVRKPPKDARLEEAA